MEASSLACLSIEWLNGSYLLAYVMGAASTVCVLASFVIEWRRKKFSWLIVYTPLLILQPAWRLVCGEVIHGSRAGSSDCGFGNRGESIFLTAALVAILVIVIREDLNKRVFLLRLIIVCWIIHVGMFLLGLFGLLSSFLFAVFSDDL